jgi:hypothetical protein
MSGPEALMGTETQRAGKKIYHTKDDGSRLNISNCTGGRAALSSAIERRAGIEAGSGLGGYK